MSKGVANPGRSGDGAVGSTREHAEAGARRGSGGAEDHYRVGWSEAPKWTLMAKAFR